MVGLWENSNELSGWIERGDFLDQVRLCQLLNKDCAPWN